MKKFESLFQPAKLVGKPISHVIGLSFPELKFGYFVLFVSVLSHSMSELYTVCIFWFPYSVRNVLKIFIIFLNRIDLLGNWISQFFGFCKGRPISI